MWTNKNSKQTTTKTVKNVSESPRGNTQTYFFRCVCLSFWQCCRPSSLYPTRSKLILFYRSINFSVVADVENSLKPDKCPKIRLNSKFFFTFFRNKVNGTHKCPFERPLNAFRWNIQSFFVSYRLLWIVFSTLFFPFLFWKWTKIISYCIIFGIRSYVCGCIMC